MSRCFLGFVLSALVCLPGSARAAVRPHALFTDNMVLQRDMKVPVWGTAADGEQVTVRFQGQEVSATSAGGKWQVRLQPLKAGGPFELVIQGSNTVTLKNVLVGEVWVCSGQSNMEWAVSRSADPEKTISGSANPQIRLYTVPRTASGRVRRDTVGSWVECGPATVDSFSAVGYAFGRDLQKALNVPVGLINSSWGGTLAEAWTSRPSLAAHSQFRAMAEQADQYAKAYEQQLDAYLAQLEKYLPAARKARAQGDDLPPAPAQPAYNPNIPTALYNGKIAPLQPFAIRGAIWYQGESNVGRAHEYRALFPLLIEDWRKTWGQGDFPFLFVQLAPYLKIVTEPEESAWAELREAQLLTSRKVPNTAVAVITDYGDEHDIHPKWKEPVGARLALAARAVAYGEKLVYSGPVYESLKVDGDKAVLSFTHTGGGLVAKGGSLLGFAVAGEDRKFVKAEAEIVDDKVVVRSPKVSKPVAVRYGWANCPVVNLYNKEGLPASPFRTDDFPMVTAPKPAAAQ